MSGTVSGYARVNSRGVRFASGPTRARRDRPRISGVRFLRYPSKDEWKECLDYLQPGNALTFLIRRVVVLLIYLTL